MVTPQKELMVDCSLPNSSHLTRSVTLSREERSAISPEMDPLAIPLVS